MTLSRKELISIKAAYWALFLICPILTSCGHQKNALAQYQIDLQHGFEGTLVEVWIDQDLIFKNVVDTDSSSGFAHSIPTALTGRNLTVRIKDKFFGVSTQTFQPNPRKGRFIGINHAFGKITIRQRAKPFLYY